MFMQRKDPLLRPFSSIALARRIIEPGTKESSEAGCNERVKPNKLQYNEA
jgi:hypothetical protein